MDFLSEHLRIELEHSYGLKHFLDESIGLIPGIEIIRKKVMDLVESEIMPELGIGSPYETYGIVIDEESLKDSNTFFKYLDISLRLKIGNVSSYKSAYDYDKSNVLEGKVNIFISVSARTGQELYNVISANVAHELTHAYEDYNRQIESKENLRDLVKRKHYNDYFNSYPDDFMNNVCDFIYFTFPSEIKAIIGELYDQLEPRFKDKMFFDSNEISNELKTTESYRKYKKCSDFVNSLSLLDDRHQKIVIDVVNEKTKLGFEFYQQVVKYLNKLWRRFKNEFEKQAPKIVYKAYWYFSDRLPMLHTNQTANVKLSEHFDNLLKRSK